MLTPEQMAQGRAKTLAMLAQAGIVVTPSEAENIEVSDVGLGLYPAVGIQAIVYVNTDRVCAKEIVMLPGQSFPEHLHPPVGADLGKEETFRCRAGEIYLYLPGEPTPNSMATPPESRKAFYSSFRELVLRPGDQATLLPGTPHWFAGGPEGGIFSEFSTNSRDELDLFPDPGVRRTEG